MFKDMAYLKSGFRQVYQYHEDPRMTESRANNAISRIQQQIEQLALQVNTRLHEHNDDTTEPQLYPGAQTNTPLHQFSSSMMELMNEFGNPEAMDAAQLSVDANQGLTSLLQPVQSELMSYSQEQAIRTYAKSPLKWWYEKKETYPILSRCARIIFSVPASAGPLELDIGHAGMIVTRHRASLSGSIVEAMTMVNRNRSLVDLLNVDQCNADELRSKLPTHLEAEYASGATSLLDALDVHFPEAMNAQVAQMMDAIVLSDADD